jgi:hypothetical protein
MLFFLAQFVQASPKLYEKHAGNGSQAVDLEKGISLKNNGFVDNWARSGLTAQDSGTRRRVALTNAGSSAEAKLMMVRRASRFASLELYARIGNR